ncbi:hypothetical protein, partial [Lactobacillus delbrueckii]|uniref:hypothetical protein n=1 Tax=Lactobacillus delbrueckii TaxID=1584 RepID=UPI001E5979D1
PVFVVDDYLAAAAFANKSQKLLQAFFLIIHSGANVLDDPKLIANFPGFYNSMSKKPTITAFFEV